MTTMRSPKTVTPDPHAMSSKLVIAANLGLLRAYREFQRRADIEPHLELIKELKLQAAHEKISDQVSDKAGRFPRHGFGISASDSANARRNRDAEQQRRLIKRLAETVNELLVDESVDECRLAISAPIHRQLLDALDHRAREKVTQVLASDLAGTNPQSLKVHFEEASSESTSSSRGSRAR